jgi:hypothetical protein
MYSDKRHGCRRASSGETPALKTRAARQCRPLPVSNLCKTTKVMARDAAGGQGRLARCQSLRGSGDQRSTGLRFTTPGSAFATDAGPGLSDDLTGHFMHYDRPNNEAPQTMLLSPPAQPEVPRHRGLRRKGDGVSAARPRDRVSPRGRSGGERQRRVGEAYQLASLSAGRCAPHRGGGPGRSAPLTTPPVGGTRAPPFRRSRGGERDHRLSSRIACPISQMPQGGPG